MPPPDVPAPAPPPPNTPPPRPQVPQGGFTGTTSGQYGDGIPDFIYDPNTGDVSFTSDGIPHMVGMLLVYSVSNQLLTSNHGAFSVSDPTGILTAKLGRILPANLTESELLGDLTLQYVWSGMGLRPRPYADLIISDSPPPVMPPVPPVNPRPITPPGGATGTTAGVLGDGTPDFIYDSSTGNLRFVSDGLPHVVGLIDAYSASGKFLTPTSGEITRMNSDDMADVDFGQVLPANLTEAELLSDLTLHYTWNGQGVKPPWSAADLIVM